MHKPKLRISASKARQWDNCQLALKFKYIDKLPELDQTYFKHGLDVEHKYCNSVDVLKQGENPVFTMESTDLDAKALFELETLRKDCLEYGFEFQKTYKQCRCKKCGGWSNIAKDAWEFEKCDHCGVCEFESWALVGVLDIYLPQAPRNWDVKTSASGWTETNLQEIKRQAKIYKHFTGQDLWFAVVNKTNHTAKVFPTSVKGFDDLWVRCEELALAFELEAFEPSPSYKCKFCSFKDVCEYH